MMGGGEFQAFMRVYFPRFLLGFFTCLMSVALSLVVWIDEHWLHHPDNATYTLLFSTALTIPLCLGHFAMVRGWKWAMWAVLPVPGITLLIALSLFGSGLPALLLAIMLALPLLALLIFNTQRHREMREVLAQQRQLRRAQKLKRSDRL